MVQFVVGAMAALPCVAAPSFTCGSACAASCPFGVVWFGGVVGLFAVGAPDEGAVVGVDAVVFVGAGAELAVPLGLVVAIPLGEVDAETAAAASVAVTPWPAPASNPAAPSANVNGSAISTVSRLKPRRGRDAQWRAGRVDIGTFTYSNG
jgi:hypothetical protein